MSTCAIYYKDFISEDKRIIPSKSRMMSKGHDKFCDEILKSEGLSKNIDGLTIICRLYELEVSPQHAPILGFVDIFIKNDEEYYSRVTLEHDFKENEGLRSDLIVAANSLIQNISPLNICKEI